MRKNNISHESRRGAEVKRTEQLDREPQNLVRRKKWDLVF